MVLSIALQVRDEECQMPLSLTRVLGNRLLPDSCDDVHTHFKRNCYELAGQPASRFRQPVEMVTQAFVANGARTAVSSANWNLRCSMRGQGCPRSALCDQPLSGASSKAWRGSTRMSSANLQLSARRVLQTWQM